MTSTTSSPKPKEKSFPDDLVRMVPAKAARIEHRSDSPAGTIGTLYGYAAVFESWTEIESYEGHFLERIAAGAFADALRDHGDSVKVMFNHGMDPVIGEKPLGKPSVLREDSRGLYMEVPLDDTSYNRDLLASLKSGAIDGMSFRFRVAADNFVNPSTKTAHNPKMLPERTITRVGRLFEAGPVTYPAYLATSAGARASAVWKGLREHKEAQRSRSLRAKALSLGVRARLAAIESEEHLRKYGDLSPRKPLLVRVDKTLADIDAKEAERRRRFLAAHDPKELRARNRFVRRGRR